MVPTDVELAAAAANGGAPAPATVVPIAAAPVVAAPVAPAAPPAPAAAAPAPAPAAPPAPVPAAPPVDPAWLGDRINQAKRSGQGELLSKYGVKTADELDAKLARLRELETASLTDAQRQQQELETLRTQATSAAPAIAVIKTRVERELKQLTDDQRAAVIAIAGEDPTAQLRTIDALSPTWGLAPAGSAAAAAAAPTAAAPSAPAAPAPSAPAPLPPPGNTVAPGAAPAPVVPGSPPDHKAHYDSIKKTNPIAAAHYLKRHQDQIYPPTT